MHFILSDIKLPLFYNEAALCQSACRGADIQPKELLSCRLVRRSLDARKKQDIHYLAQVEFKVSDATGARLSAKKNPHLRLVEKTEAQSKARSVNRLARRPVVVGLGPAGLFAALRLAECGLNPIVIERGKAIAERVRDVENYWNTGLLNIESNVMFGEGGAGTFSDGKLTSRSKDPRQNCVLDTLIACGAGEEIGYEAKPHIGTDRLRTVVTRLRESIIAHGGEVRFSTCLTDIELVDGRIKSIQTQCAGKTEHIETDALVLAIGQGARDTVRMLHGRGLSITKKPFAVGVRIEHPQAIINRAQFGALWNSPHLGAAEYKLTAEVNGRGVYSFCMCPGGYVVASASGAEQVVVNGMSNAARDGVNANAALVVQVRPEDMPDGALGGIAFCEEIEKRAFLAGGGTGHAPAERLADFMARRKPTGLGKLHQTYRPGLVPCDLFTVLPDFVAESLHAALPVFFKKIQGFDYADALLTAVESRTSAPYRIERDKNLAARNCAGLYPIGEGAGYAGGIVSSAIDGIKAAEVIAYGTEA